MKAILEFDMNDPDDQELHKSMIGVRDLECALHDFSQDTLRKYRKYGIPEEVTTAIMDELGPEATHEDIIQATAEHIEEQFYEALRAREASFD